jgi:predicted Zn-dependent protease
MKTAIAGILVFCLVLSGCASSRERKSEDGGAGDAQEAAIGAQIHTTILQSFYPYTDPKVVGYINEIGGSLTEHAQRDLSYRFTILYSDKIYATSAPGGYVYVTTGMLYFLENEAELAAVLAQEIGHLQFKNPHIVANSRKVLDTIAKGGAMVGPAFGPIGALAALGLVMVSNVSQPNEMLPEDKMVMADKRALHYMLEAGQDPQGLIDVTQRFLRANNEVVPYFYDYYRSRPITEARMAALNKEFSKLPLEGRDFQTRYEIYQEMTKGVREMYRR